MPARLLIELRQTTNIYHHYLLQRIHWNRLLQITWKQFYTLKVAKFIRKKSDVTGRMEHARLNKQKFQWRYSFSEIFILIITLIGLG